MQESSEAERVADTTEGSQANKEQEKQTDVELGKQTDEEQENKADKELEDKTVDAVLVDELFSRQWISNCNYVLQDVPHSRSFTVVSYNILADVHAVNDYETASWLKAGAKEWTMVNREARFMKELAYLDADVICLQEVATDYFSDKLLPALRASGYEGVYFSRETHNGKEYPEGEATFYRVSRFSLESHKGLRLARSLQKEIDASSTVKGDLKDCIKADVGSQAVALLTKLKVIGGEPTCEQFVSIANIHSAYYDRPNRPDKQCLQIAYTMRELLKLCNLNEPHIICGDFNSWMGSVPYQLMFDGHLSKDSLAALQAVSHLTLPGGETASLVKHWPEGFQYSEQSDMQSAYFTVTNDEPLTTRYAKDGSVRGVDFIWFSGSTLGVTGVLRAVNSAHLEGGIPSSFLPSDHHSLKAQFVFKML